MPPPVTDEDMDSDGGPDQIPAKGKIPTKAEEEEEAVADEQNEEEDDEGEDDEGEDDEGEDDDEYKVENILAHRFRDGGMVEYNIKWLGWDKKSDRTWEPIENLENAMDLVNAYHDEIGGAPIQGPASSKKKGGAKRSASTANLDSPAVKPSASKKRGRQSDTNGLMSTANLPSGTWDNDVLRVHTVLEETPDPTTKSKGKVLLGLIEWNKGGKTQHPLATLRRKCPQRMLDYYEQHLVFKVTTAKDDDADAEAAAAMEE